MESVRDTLVSGKTARVLQISSFGEDNMPEREEIMYGDADRIYHYLPEADSFYMLYDFSAVAGDTLFIRTTPFQDYYGRFGLVSQFILLVDSTSSMIIDGDTLRVQYVHALEPEDPLSGLAWGGQRILTEKIGAGLMFGLPSVLPAAGCWGGLRCYSDGTLSVDFLPSFLPTCDFLTSLDSEWENPNLIHFWPNPADDKLTLEFEIPDTWTSASLVLYNAQGQQLSKSAVLTGSPQHLKYSTEHLPAGLYFLTLISGDKVLSYQKIIIGH